MTYGNGQCHNPPHIRACQQRMISDIKFWPWRPRNLYLQLSPPCSKPFGCLNKCQEYSSRIDNPVATHTGLVHAKARSPYRQDKGSDSWHVCLSKEDLIPCVYKESEGQRNVPHGSAYSVVTCLKEGSCAKKGSCRDIKSLAIILRCNLACTLTTIGLGPAADWGVCMLSARRLNFHSCLNWPTSWRLRGKRHDLPRIIV